MISTIDPGSELFLADAARIQDKIALANRQISSGKKLSVASDLPDQIGPLLQLRAVLQHNRQIQSNLSLAKANADAADTALASAIKLMDSALMLANQGTSPTMSATARQSLAQQVQALQEQMVNLSQTAVQGKYIFSVDQDSSPSYVLDLTPPPANEDGTPGLRTAGVDQLLSGQTATRRIEDPAGGSFSAAKTAGEIFDHGRNADGTFASDNVFAALNFLRLALVSNDPVQIAGTISAIKASTDHLNSMETFYGDVQKHIQNSGDFAGAYDARLQAQISQIEDADATSAALAITQANTQLQAAFQMRAKMPHTTLFDFLG